ncbi:hypothetical protein M9Y10_036315 [Tritrichomonas musculus]|uniref:Myb-like DNA-binding domain containing protein n=1 Tax=Tritrichomonas musculus TaxID=1915356 RepID=A0ABR2GW33_9EUKA
MQRQSAHVLVDVILSLYPENTFQRNPDMYNQTMNLIIHFIKNPSKFQECVQTSIALTGTSQPIERLHDILTVGNEPIPFTNGDVDDTKDDSIRKKSRTWTTYEDNRLIAGIYRFGIDNWTSISRFVGNGRTRSQCSQRWQRGLDPHLSKDQWSVAEEAFLLQLVQYYGEKSWTQIAGKMGNRSDVQCRYRYKQMQKDRSLHVRPMAAPNSLPYGSGVRKTHSSYLPHIMPAQPQQIQQLQQQQQQQQLNLLMHQNQGQHQSPVQSPRLRNVQPQIFADDLYLNTQRQSMGNLRSSQSVPSIQFPPFPQFEQQNQANNFRPTPSENNQFNQMSENQMPPMPQSLQAQYQQMQLMQQNQQMPPLPRQRAQPPIPPPPAPSPNLNSGRPLNSDLFDSFNDSFFDDNDFDATSQVQQPPKFPSQSSPQMQNQMQPQPQIPPQSQFQNQPQEQMQVPQLLPNQVAESQAQRQQQNLFSSNNDNNNNNNDNNGLNTDDSVTFSLPTFDSDVFSLF